MAAANFWDNQETAQETVGQLKSLKSILSPMTELLSAGEDLMALIEMGEEEPEIVPEIEAEIGRIEKVLEELELKALLNGAHDACGAILTINARDGGTDANDWAEMMLRMYMQWAQKNDYAVELLDRNPNPDAGINSATITLRGPMAYGCLLYTSPSPRDQRGSRMPSSA